jgi:hypothetical protein
MAPRGKSAGHPAHDSSLRGGDAPPTTTRATMTNVWAWIMADPAARMPVELRRSARMSSPTTTERWGPLDPRVKWLLTSNVVDSAGVVTPDRLSSCLEHATVTALPTGAPRTGNGVLTVPTNLLTMRITSAGEPSDGSVPRAHCVKMTGSIQCVDCIASPAMLLANAARALGPRAHPRRPRGTARVVFFHNVPPGNALPSARLHPHVRIDRNRVARFIPGGGHPPNFVSPNVMLPDANGVPTAVIVHADGVYVPGRGSSHEAAFVVNRFLALADAIDDGGHSAIVVDPAGAAAAAEVEVDPDGVRDAPGAPTQRERRWRVQAQMGMPRTVRRPAGGPPAFAPAPAGPTNALLPPG